MDKLTVDGREIHKSDYSRLIVRSEPLEAGGSNFGTEFDLETGCEACGSGATQASLLRLSKGDVRRRFAVAEARVGDIVVNDDVAQVLRPLLSRGTEFRAVVGHDSTVVPGRWQLFVNSVLPTMSALTRGIVQNKSDSCKQCHRDCHYDEPRSRGLVVYDRANFGCDGELQFALTWECFGKGVVRHQPERILQLRHFMANGLLIVGPAVRDAFVRTCAKVVAFEPVYLAVSA